MNGCVSMSELTTFIDRWEVDNQDVNIREIISALAEWKRGAELC
jgi:hypothetical protein